MSYNQKKFLDYDGLIHLLKKFDDYPTNDILGTVIDSIGAAIDAKVSDVQINGTSIIQDGVANVPVASRSVLGVVKTGGMGISTNNSGEIYISQASSANAKSGNNNFAPVTPTHQHESVFYGLAKAAGADEKDSTLPLGTYSDAAKTAIQNMLGVTDALAVKLNAAEAGLRVVRLI